MYFNKKKQQIFFSKKTKISQFNNNSIKNFSSSNKKLIVGFSFKEDNFEHAKTLAILSLFLQQITSQKHKLSFSKKDSAHFSIRKKNLVSVFVTMRNAQIIAFIEKWAISCNNINITKTIKFNMREEVSLLSFPEIEKEMSKFQQNTVLLSIKAFIII